MKPPHKPKKPRRELRRLISLPLEIRGSSRRFEASGRDVTFSGVRIRTAGHVTEGERVGVRFVLPGFANEDLNFVAEVRWVEREINDREEVAGLEFVHTPASKRMMGMLLYELESGNLREIERRQPTMRWRPPPRQA